MTRNQKPTCFKRILTSALIASLLATPTPSRADIFGGDTIVLTQILAQTVQQLIQLKQILETGKDNLDLLHDVNKGISDIIGIANTSGDILDSGMFKELKTPEDVNKLLKRLSGVIPDSSFKEMQGHTESVVSEAVSLNNSLYDYAKEMDKVGENIKHASQFASPKGAQKLTVETLGVMVTVLNQSLRAQASGLKLQAQAMATQNHKDKEFSRQVRETSKNLRLALQDSKPSFKLPEL